VKLEREKFRVMEEKYSAAREAEERARADVSGPALRMRLLLFTALG
jgi:hypothetical protein